MKAAARRREVSSAGLLVCALAALVLSATRVDADVVDREWIEVSTPRFTILSRLSEKRTRRLAQDLELFAQVVLSVTNARRQDSPVPTRVVLIDENAEWREIGSDHSLAGFYFPTLRENYMAMRDFQGDLDRAIVQHEYIHFLLRNESRFHYPRWYEEGYAEVFSTVKHRGDAVVVGSVPIWRIDELRYRTWLPIRRIVQPDGYESWTEADRSMYYAEAWALIHYLVLGNDDGDAFAPRLDAHIRAIEEGMPVAKAFEQAFGIGLSKLDHQVRRYLERGRYPAKEIPADRFETDWEIRARVPSEAEVALGVATLQLYLGELESARRGFARVLRLDPQSAHALAGLGRVSSAAGRYVDAARCFEGAVELAPDDPVLHVDLARFLLDRARLAPAEERSASDVARARRHLVKAWKLDRSAPEPYAVYGYSFLVEGDDPERAVEMLEQAERILPSFLWIRASLAEAYLAVGRDEEAVAMARSVLAWSHRRSWDARRAQDVIAMADALGLAGTGIAEEPVSAAR